MLLPSVRLKPLAGCLLLTLPPAAAEVVVQPAVPITHRVQIQPIRVRTTGGAVATTFGNETQSTYILQQINRIWAQVGVRIDWLPFNDYTNNFAYQGTGSGARPQADLDTIIDNAGAPPKGCYPPTAPVGLSLM